MNNNRNSPRAMPHGVRDGSQWEYVTFAPEGRTCTACMKPIQRLEQVRRGSFERQSGAPFVVYRHIECPKG